MLRISIIAKNYAKALFLQALKTNAIDKVSSDLSRFKQHFSANFAKELQNPAISKADSVKIMANITKKLQLEQLSSNFFAIIAQNKRLNLFLEVYAEFNRLVRAQKNILDIEIISSEKLDQPTIDNISDIIKRKHNKELEITQTIRKEILGGIQIRIGSTLIDASLQNQLYNIEKNLLSAIG